MMRFLQATIVTLCALLFIVSDATATNLCRYDPPLTQGGYSPSFLLGGEVLHPKTFDETTLRQYESTKLEVVYGAGSGIESGSFVGVLLWDLINEAGVIVDPARRNDRLRMYVVISGSDGYQAILSLGEIIPDFGGQPIVVAYERDGQQLGANQGMARLVVPGDKRGGRHVNRITHIAVCDPTPGNKNK